MNTCTHMKECNKVVCGKKKGNYLIKGGHSQEESQFGIQAMEIFLP